MENNQQTLKSSMKTRHVVMLSLGGAIGAGLFAGSSSAIQAAGPSVILAYLLAGLILFVVIYGVGQIVLHQKTKSLGMSGIVSPYLGERFGHFTDWVYWADSMAVMVAEAAAIAQFLHVWWPQVPNWAFVLGVAILTLGINLYSVRVFAETEYWLALLKVLVVILLIVIGFWFLMVQVFHLGFQSGLSQMNQHGGFMPNGYKGIFNAMLMVIYSYGGSELIAITVSEVENPKEAIPKAIRGVMSRIVAFYVIPMFLFLELFSWQFLSTTKASPFVLIFDKFGIPFAGDLINLVIILALFSVINSMIYATSRSLYARVQGSKHGFGRYLSQLSTRQAPVRAIAFCTGVLFAGVVLSYIFGNALFDIMAGSISYTVLITWMMLLLASIVFYFREGMAVWKKIVSLITLVILLVIAYNLVISNPIGITLFALVVCFLSFISFSKSK
ncbi:MULTISPECIES: amino acid permease [unclassified Lactococcus]|uniref:amino acid permease n=1 Tax=unclassified Lactococcus TaxID=2643510 RepID=UPI0011C70F74|nr:MULTISPECIES: amino acid permease [unclassified Lactococcus]MQW23860.1 amino acid permease [Lactococcus sp. dk101]TXK37209.1 amino acid permease [Lactococcus sp. dk310]TXK48108.1 amino acid permease [Lactococcus sp. dk322]